MMKPFPIVRKAYSLLIQEEKKREISSRQQYISEGVSLNVGINGGPNNAGGHFNRNLNQVAFKNNTDFKKFFCDYCKRPDHTKDRCYKLRGFLNNFKGKKERKIVAPVHGYNADFAFTSTEKPLIPELSSV